MTLPIADVQLTIDVLGRPAPKGSKKCVGGRGKVKHRLVEMSELLPAWTEAIVTAASARARLDHWQTLDGPVEVEVWAWFPRPASEPNRRYPHTRAVGDIDKIGRAILDALTEAKVIRDDSLVVDLLLHERYAEVRPGARITVRAI